MEREIVRCPKCSHEQRDGVECEACGLIFAKYIEAQKYRQEQEAAREVEKEQPSKRFGGFSEAVILVVLTAAATYYFMRPTPSPTPPAHQQAVEVQPAPVFSEMVARRPEPKQATVRQKDPAAGSVGSAIEQAREATVSIETPWGVGSGFFVSKNCIATSRHVVEINPNVSAQLREKVEERKKFIDSARQTIDRWRSNLRGMNHEPTRRNLETQIELNEQRLKTELSLYEEAERQLEKMEKPLDVSDIKVILADGTSQNPSGLRMSEKHDLAILSLLVDPPHVLQRPTADFPLHQGDKLYAVGSPVGLRNTVTAGISRLQNESTRSSLQTDAPSTPATAAVLIDERGFVRGVNTMILKNTEGIGFAIPIDQVFEDLGFYIY
jgi:S1-C subfamily serine protease